MAPMKAKKVAKKAPMKAMKAQPMKAMKVATKARKTAQPMKVKATQKANEDDGVSWKEYPLVWTDPVVYQKQSKKKAGRPKESTSEIVGLWINFQTRTVAEKISTYLQ